MKSNVLNTVLLALVASIAQIGCAADRVVPTETDRYKSEFDEKVARAAQSGRISIENMMLRLNTAAGNQPVQVLPTLPGQSNLSRPGSSLSSLSSSSSGSLGLSTKDQFESFVTAKGETKEFKALRDALKSQIQKRLADGVPNAQGRQKIIQEIITNIRDTHYAVDMNENVLREMVFRLLYHEIKTLRRTEEIYKTFRAISSGKMPAALVEYRLKPLIIGTPENIAPELSSAIRYTIRFEQDIEQVFPTQDDTRFVVVFRDHTARLYDAQGQQLQHQEINNVSSIYWSPNSQNFIIEFRDDTARLYNAQGQQLQHPAINNVRHVNWSPNSQNFIVKFRNDTACFYNAQGEQLQHPEINNVASIYWSPNSQNFIVESSNGRARLYNAEGKEFQHQEINNVSIIRWNSNSQNFVVVFRDDTARLYDAQGKQLEEGEKLGPAINDTFDIPWRSNSRLIIAVTGQNTMIIKLTPQEAYRQLNTCTIEQLQFIIGLSPRGQNLAIHLNQEQTIILNQLRQHHPFIARFLESHYRLLPYQAPLVQQQQQSQQSTW